MSQIVKLHQLSKSFAEGDQQRTVLSELNTTFEQGKFTVILGSSGSGKSTLLNLISGIEQPSGGHVEIDGTNITGLRDKERTLFRRDNVGFVFQFFNLIPTLTVLENVILPMELAGRRTKEVAKIGGDLLTKVGLGDRFETFPDKLSGGEQQRVALARALAHDPMLVLADEPTGNLDETTGELVLDLLLNLTRGLGKTLIMATHSPEVVPYADRVLRVQKGILVEDSRVEPAATIPQ